LIRQNLENAGVNLLRLAETPLPLQSHALLDGAAKGGYELRRRRFRHVLASSLAGKGDIGRHERWSVAEGFGVERKLCVSGRRSFETRKPSNFPPVTIAIGAV
jgi:hypothetical protein